MSIGPHIQNTIPDWKLWAKELPDTTMFKTVDLVQVLSEAHRDVNPTFRTTLRHHNDGINFYTDYDASRREAEMFFSQFLDGTFDQHAYGVKFVEDANEYFATGESPESLAAKIQWVRAVCDVWNDKYRHRWPWIRLCLANTAVGNDIPLEVAKIAYNEGHVLGYHPYTAIWEGRIFHDYDEHGQLYNSDARWYSGRWRYMDAEYRSHGIYVPWLMGEMGAIRIASSAGNMAPNDGWRHPETYTHGDKFEHYLDLVRYMMKQFNEFNLLHNGRCLGGTLFTTRGPGWKWFETAEGEWPTIAPLVNELYNSYEPPDPPIEPPPIEPPPGDIDEDALWAESVRLQEELGLKLNPGAALQKAILADAEAQNRHVAITTNEFTMDGHVAQAAEYLDNGERRVYYVKDQDWGNVTYMDEPG